MPEPAARFATFMGLEIEASTDVLVPREETELLARVALEVLGAGDGLRVIDMCCGSGNLACAIAHARPGARVWASDLTDPCVALARRNVARLGLGDRVEIRQGDLFAALEELRGTIDLVVCNPPYISTGRLAKESAHLLDDQPREAFDAGPYGLSIHKRVVQEAPGFLKPGAWLAMEIGLGQDKQLETLVSRAKGLTDHRFFADERGAPRVVAARAQAQRND
jgi:HemK-like putative methylase